MQNFFGDIIQVKFVSDGEYFSYKKTNNDALDILTIG